LASDQIPSGALRRFIELKHDSEKGEIKVSESRLLLDAAAEGDRIYAVLTTEGWLCYGPARGPGGKCVRAMPNPVTWSIVTVPGGVAVMGVHTTDVSQIEVVAVGGVIHHPRIGESAYRVFIPNEHLEDVELLLVRTADGVVSELLTRSL
jgi:hypothetical protein